MNKKLLICITAAVLIAAVILLIFGPFSGKYLILEDDETGEIIPSSGRKGRRSSTPNETTNNTDTNPLSIKIKALEKTISDKNDEITSLKTEIKKLNSVISNYEKICQGIVNTLVSVSGK